MTDRDRARLAGTHPLFIAKLAPILDALDMFVVVGVRTAAQQAAEYAKGRTMPGPHAGEPGHPALGSTVTNCDGVRTKSNHQVHADGFGHAADCAFNGPKPYGGDFKKFGELVVAAGLKWGGNFPHLADLDHAELP